MSKFTLRISRLPGETVEAWRMRAVALAHEELERRDLVLQSIRLASSRGGATLPAGASVVTVTVRGDPQPPREDARSPQG
jgi:hypothetical protein